jgi:glycosyltransferase involved in cell wall biosynthesis
MRTVESALGQAGVQVEVVVVDDGSTDATADQLAARADGRVRLLRNERSVGQARARNQAIAAAEGEWLAFLDDDDLWAPQKTRAQLDAAQAAEAGFVYGPALVVDDGFRILDVHEAPEPSELLCALVRGNAVPAGASNVMARSELSLLTDWDLWLRLAGESRAAVCGDPVMAYVQHGRNYILEGGVDKCREMEYLAAKHVAVEKRCGVEFDVLGLVHWIAGGQAAAGQRLRAVRTHLRGAVRYRNRVLLAARPPDGPAADGPLEEPSSAPEWLLRLRDRN